MPEAATVMDNAVYIAAVEGDVSVLENLQTKTLVDHQKSYEKNSIIHIAARHERLEFVEAALKRFPELISEVNCDGNNALHIAAEVGNKGLVQLLLLSPEAGRRVEKPWWVENLEGNTPLHLALINGNADVARLLLDKDPALSSAVNIFNETPLHLAVKHLEDDDKDSVRAAMKLLIYKHGSASLSTKGQHSVGEDLYPIIELLLQQGESSVACWRDSSGLTPLLRAALLRASNFRVISIILKYCPQSAEVSDLCGRKTVLHLINKIPSYQQGKEFLDFPVIRSLRNHQDCVGNTPMHIAARNKDMNMVRVLLECSVNLTLKNHQAVSAAALLQQLVFQDNSMLKDYSMLKNQGPSHPKGVMPGSIDGVMEGGREMTKAECEAAENARVSFLWERLETLGMDFLLSRAPGGGNILHLVLKRIQGKESYFALVDFIKAAVEKFPVLISQTDLNGNNLIHVLAQSDTKCSILHDAGKYSGRLLDHFHDHFQKLRQEAGTEKGVYYPPWKVRNVNGETPVHLALVARSYRFARKLLKLDKSLAAYVNNHNDTPLHLLSNYNAELMGEIKVWFLINLNADAAYLRDQDGLTPLLRAARDHNFEMLTELCIHCPESANVTHTDGKTFWHMLANRALNCKLDRMIVAVTRLFENHELRILLETKDNYGNTPLHLAIENRNFDLAKLILTQGVTAPPQTLLEAKNKDGVSSGDLIGSAEHLPSEFGKFLWEQHLLSGYRSLYGVPTTKIEEYANTIGVTAALLATITFTAGFTVPGGLNSANGSPLLMGRPAFQVFLVSDVLAMCLSMMVLFCLLWIMTTGHRKESLLLLDVSVFLLQLSFYATLLTFMTGLYVTIIHISPGIAIFSCILCSLLILLMHKRFVLVALAPFCAVLISAFHIASDLVYNPRRMLFCRNIKPGDEGSTTAFKYSTRV